MSSRVKFFRERDQARDTRQFLNTHGIKNYIRERTPSTVVPGELPYGYDVLVLRDDDVDEARQLLAYEFGSEWGDETK